MTPSIHSDSWGKTDVRVVKISRDHDAAGDHILDLDVSTSLRGDTDEVYRNGDNAKILTTDAQRNAVYAFAKEQPRDDIELLARGLASYFFTSQAAVTQATVAIQQHGWSRTVVDGTAAPHSFHAGCPDIRTARVEVSADDVAVYAGISGLRLLNTTGSEFRGFPRDRYTTGVEVADRVLATELDAEWRYRDGRTAAGFTDVHSSVRSIVIETFASVPSRSIQYSMYNIGTAVLENHPGITEVRLRVPNIHHYPVDLSPFDLTNDREVFMTSAGPHSLIEATFGRAVD